MSLTTTAPDSPGRAVSRSIVSQVLFVIARVAAVVGIGALVSGCATIAVHESVFKVSVINGYENAWLEQDKIVVVARSQNSGVLATESLRLGVINLDDLHWTPLAMPSADQIMPTRQTGKRAPEETVPIYRHVGQPSGWAMATLHEGGGELTAHTYGRNAFVLVRRREDELLEHTTINGQGGRHVELLALPLLLLLPAAIAVDVVTAPFQFVFYALPRMFASH